MYRTEQFRFVFFQPGQLGCRKVTRRVQQMRQALLLPYIFKSTFAIRYGTAVAPNNGRTQNLHFLVYKDKPVHLVRDSDRLYIRSLNTGSCDSTLYRYLQIFPPVVGLLFRPTGFHGLDRSLFFRIKISPDRQPCIYIYNRSLHRRTSYITT